MSDNTNWYHIISTTYGTWLYGDARGFRTRHHREHVEGDYKNPPPPGTYEELGQQSRDSLKRPSVVLPVRFREIVGRAILERLRGLGALVVCISVSGQHIHVLAKTPFKQARWMMGKAKRHVWFVLRDHGRVGKLWGKRGKEIPIKDRQHQLNTYRYILRHAQQGAWIWTMFDDKQQPSPSPRPAPRGELHDTP
jgi:hypothetical protein